MLRGLGALGRAISFAWRRSLQLRVVSLTLGLSLAVILVLGFVLTSQITDRILEVKVRAATEEMVKDQGGTGRDLKAKINSLTPRLDAELLEDLHESRLVGNDSIHVGVQYAAEEIADVAELLWEAAFVLYEQPAQKASMRAARKARHDAARSPRAAS